MFAIGFICNIFSVLMHCVNTWVALEVVFCTTYRWIPRYFCENCGSKQDAMKSCSLVRENLPFILCLTLKRFVRGKQTYKVAL